MVSCNTGTAASPVSSRKKRIPGRKWHVEARQWDNLPSRRRSAGVRNVRREQNLNFLLDLGGEADLSDFVDLSESMGSAFTELFSEADSMRAWHDFINWPEDEQQRLLSPSDDNTLSPDLHVTSDDNRNGEEEEEAWTLLDNRNVHPAACGTAEQCFRRIDQNMRAVLNHRHLPLGKLELVERDVCEFFAEWPDSVYVSQGDSFERLLLHAVCQYLHLKSHSVDTNKGRQTEVENKHGVFHRPRQSLTAYLYNRRQENGNKGDIEPTSKNRNLQMQRGQNGGDQMQDAGSERQQESYEEM